MTVRHVPARFQAINPSTGQFVPLARLRFYDPGTTNPRTVYSDKDRLIAINQTPNGISADSAGFYPQIYVQDGTYKYTLHTQDEVLVDTEDNVDPGLGVGAGVLGIPAGGTGSGTAAGARVALGAASQAALDALDLRVADAESLLDNPILAASVSITYAASVAPDFSADETRHITLTGPLTLGAPTVTPGQKIRLYLIQDATGSRTWAVNAAYKFPGGYVPPLSTTANAIDMLVGHARTSGEIQVEEFKRQDPLTNIAILEDQKSQNTPGGTFTQGADRTRDLNTTVSDLAGIIVSLTSNQFTLRAGTYLINWAAPAGDQVGAHQSFLYNASDSSEVKRGSTSNVGATGSNIDSTGAAVVVISSNKAFEIRHRCQSTRTTTGFGLAGNFGTEIYTRVVVRKIA